MNQHVCSSRARAASKRPTPERLKHASSATSGEEGGGGRTRPPADLEALGEWAGPNLGKDPMSALSSRGFFEAEAAVFAAAAPQKIKNKKIKMRGCRGHRQTDRVISKVVVLFFSPLLLLLELQSFVQNIHSFRIYNPTHRLKKGIPKTRVTFPLNSARFGRSA